MIGTAVSASRVVDAPLSTRHQMNKGADIASADEITLGTDGNYFDITGTTNIAHIANTSWQAGAIIILQFDGILTLEHNASEPTGSEASMLLTTEANLTVEAGDTIQFVYDGTTWREIPNR